MATMSVVHPRRGFEQGVNAALDTCMALEYDRRHSRQPVPTWEVLNANVCRTLHVKRVIVYR
jgi:hypothetical protein